MNVQHAPTAMTESRERHTYVRVPERWLLPARGIWIALMLVPFGTSIATSAVSASPSLWRVPNEGLFFLALSLLGLVFFLFPSGRFVPHWMRWTLVVFVAGLVPEIFVAPFLPNTPVG